MKKLIFTVLIAGSVVFLGDYLMSNVATVELSNVDELPKITNIKNAF